MIKISH